MQMKSADTIRAVRRIEMTRMGIVTVLAPAGAEPEVEVVIELVWVWSLGAMVYVWEKDLSWEMVGRLDWVSFRVDRRCL
jgi:hypothetical protein